MRLRLGTLFLIGGILSAQASVCVLDFETAEERSRQPSGSDSSKTYGCVEEYAASGSWSYRFKTETYQEGMNRWPSVTLVPSVSDWSGYDRLVIDIANLANSSADKLYLYIANAEGRIQNGLQPSAVMVSGYRQLVVSLSQWPTTVDPTQIARIHFYTQDPVGFDLRIDRLTLLTAGEEIPSQPSWAANLQDLQRQYYEETYERGHAAAYASFRAACVAAGRAQGGMLLGQATSMETLLPRGDVAPQALSADGLFVRLARNEREAVQLLVAADGTDLADVRLTAGDLRHEKDAACLFSATNIHVGVTGYVKVSDQPPYALGRTRTTEGEPGYQRGTEPVGGGWWPDPILDYTDHTAVAGTDIQSFWVRVSCPATCRAGLYRGELTVTADGASVQVPMSVRVNNFTLPRETVLPLAITFSPNVDTTNMSEDETARLQTIAKQDSAPVKLWKNRKSEWVDFLADYGITSDNLYSTRSDGGFPNWEQLLRLREQGRLGYFNLGYWTYPADLEDETKAAWKASTIARLRPAYERAVAEGLLSKAYCYGCDEVSSSTFARVQWAVGELKENFPGLRIMTTAGDSSYGVGTELSSMDAFVAIDSTYNAERAASSRAAGHEVWWYIACNPSPPYANAFVESQAIELRQLMGAQTQKYRPDGFLYYQISIWNAENVISGTSAFTDWPVRSRSAYHGDGSWTRCGPDGVPLPTLRLENFRDGLEDLAYARLLEKRLASAPNASWASEARELLAVPAAVVSSLSNFSDDSAVLSNWRNRMADLIEESVSGNRFLFMIR